MRTRLLVAALFLALGAATVFAVWPVFGDAPWLESEQSAIPSPTAVATPRYSPEEAVGFVRAVLDHGVECYRRHARWAAASEPSGGSWLVATGCADEEGSIIGVMPAEPNLPRWRFYEESNRVIPLNDDAAELMRPKRE